MFLNDRKMTKNNEKSILLPETIHTSNGNRLNYHIWYNNTNKKFWKELICLLSLHYLKISFALKKAFAST
jgi:hypothetical protein